MCTLSLLNFVYKGKKEMTPWKEKTSNENKCCGTVEDKQKMAEMMDKCCEGMNGSGDCGSMMAECMKRCRWFPLIPLIVGIFLFLLGYYLNAEVIRILWMVVAGLIILLGTFGLIMMSIISKK
jgi:hypothetical protein